MMNFLRNAWYCAAWSNEITRTPLARTLLNEKVVMYRKEAGGIVALANVCAHRYAPMDKGKLHGDVIACPYHGMRYAEGASVTLWLRTSLAGTTHKDFWAASKFDSWLVSASLNPLATAS